MNKTRKQLPLRILGSFETNIPDEIIKLGFPGKNAVPANAPSIADSIVWTTQEQNGRLVAHVLIDLRETYTLDLLEDVSGREFLAAFNNDLFTNAPKKATRFQKVVQVGSVVYFKFFTQGFGMR